MGSWFSSYRSYVVGYTYENPEYGESAHRRTIQLATKMIDELKFLETQLGIDEFCDCKIARCVQTLRGSLWIVPPRYRTDTEFVKVTKELEGLGIQVPDAPSWTIMRN